MFVRGLSVRDPATTGPGGAHFLPQHVGVVDVRNVLGQITRLFQISGFILSVHSNSTLSGCMY